MVLLRLAGLENATEAEIVAEVCQLRGTELVLQAGARRAAAFLAAVNVCLATIQRHPQAFTLVDPTMRRALVRRFPYAIFYEIEPRQIVVYGAFHGARDPHTWRRRRDG